MGEIQGAFKQPLEDELRFGSLVNGGSVKVELASAHKR